MKIKLSWFKLYAINKYGKSQIRIYPYLNSR